MAKFYITTPIYYVNDAPHIGHAYTTVTADAIARWHRLIGDQVRFLTGTDEHGLKVARAAERQGMDPKSWADKTSKRFLEAWELLSISNDDFIRTTEPRHYATVQRFLQAVYDNGYITKGTWTGLYCVDCEDYYTESQLVEGNCPVHSRPVEVVAEENYFFKLSLFTKPLLDWYERNPDAVLPYSKANEAISFIRQGLQDISITRTSFKWGVPVPWDSEHIFYVWYDALINYVTAISYGVDQDSFNQWWPAVHHLIGKEILRFHCVWWPAMCMAAGIDPPRHVFVHGWLLVGGEKMAKSKLNQITPAELVEQFGVDAVRYHLLRDTPLGSDGDFSYEAMLSRYNADLANNLGNLLSRVTAVVTSKCGGIGPSPSLDSDLAGVADQVLEQVVRSWDSFAPYEALEATWRLIKETNAYLEANEPWRMEPSELLDKVMGDALEALRIVALLIFPAMPSTSTTLWGKIGLKGSPSDAHLPESARWGGYPGELPIQRSEPLFPRIKE